MWSVFSFDYYSDTATLAIKQSVLLTLNENYFFSDVQNWWDTAFDYGSYIYACQTENIKKKFWQCFQTFVTQD